MDSTVHQSGRSLIMPKKKVKQWSLPEVASEHRYTHIATNYNCRDLYVHLVYSHIFENKIEGILDIGHGARPLPYASDTYAIGMSLGLSNYVGAEINQSIVDLCQEHQETFKERDEAMNLSVKFFNQDVEKRFSKGFSEAIKKCNLVYMDSTLTLLENPKSFIKKIAKRVDWIYLKRTPVFPKSEKTHYKWDGMKEPSPNWRIGMDFYESLHGVKSFFFDSSTISLDCRNA